MQIPLQKHSFWPLSKGMMTSLLASSHRANVSLPLLILLNAWQIAVTMQYAAPIILERREKVLAERIALQAAS